MTEQMREFETGALRDSESNKLDFEGFLSPTALEAFAQYMNFHRQMPGGSLRDSDNWQKGFPFPVLMKSMWRHFFGLWSWHRQEEGSVKSTARNFSDPLVDACGIIFNAQAYLKQLIDEDPSRVDVMLGYLRREHQGRLDKSEKAAQFAKAAEEFNKIATKCKLSPKPLAKKTRK